MCGRFTITPFAPVLEDRFKALFTYKDFKPRYNVAPSQVLPIILNSDPKHIIPALWGYIPSWVKDPEPHGIINARDDSLTTKPIFRSAFQGRRCLVLADGFFEWQPVTKAKKVPYWITLKTQEPFAFAGIWSQVHSPLHGDFVSFGIVTTTPN